MKKIVRNSIIIVYILMTIAITFCLISYNKYNIAEFKTKYILIYNGKEYSKKDLIVINKSNELNEKDTIFYYDKSQTPVKVKLGTIKKIENIQENLKEYTLENADLINDDSILGKENEIKVYQSIGTIYSLLVSKWGYLFIIIMPMVGAFIFEIYQIIKEFKK